MNSERRVQRTGGASFSITLPKEWIMKHKVHSNSLVSIAPGVGVSLVISPVGVTLPTTVQELSLRKQSLSELKRELVALYITGAEEVRLIGSPITKKELVEIRHLVAMLVGFEIIDESAGQITIKNLLSLEKFSFQEGMEKLFIMARALLHDALTAFINRDIPGAKDCIERDYEVDKLYYLIRRENHCLLQNRISERDLGVSLEQAHYYELVAMQLERIADHGVKIASLTLHCEAAPKQALAVLIERIGEELVDALHHAALFAHDINKKQAHQLLESLVSSEKLTTQLYQEALRSKSVEATRVIDSIDRVIGYMENIAEETLDHAAQQGQ